MSRNRKLSSITVLLALVAGILGSAAPAFAATTKGTASVNLRNIKAGEQQDFVFTVTNGGVTSPIPNMSDAAYNFVRIGPATSAGEGTFLPQGFGAAGWNGSLTDLDGDSVADAVTFRGGTLAAGDDAPFTVTASAARTSADEAVKWVVEVSSDGGKTILKQNTPATDLNALTSTIRVLSVGNVAVSGPSGAIDGTATADQPNLTVDSQVTNLGIAPLEVTPTLSSNVSEQSIGSIPATVIAPGTTSTFTFPVDLAASNTDRTFTGDASAAGADGVAAPSSVLDVQDAVGLTYAAGSLSPVASVSGATQNFLLSLNKTNAPSLSIDSGTLTFTKGGETFSTALNAPVAIGEGGQGAPLSFAPVTIPGAPGSTDADGNYTPSLSLTGTDGNGAPVTRTVSISNNFEIDNLIPYVDPSLAGPADQVDPNGLSVAKNGDTLTVGGDIKKSAATGAPADGTATIVSCDLVILDADLQPVSSTPITCTNTGGSISGSTALNTTVDEGFAAVDVVVRDAAGNTAPPARSDIIAIDNLVPTVEKFVTGCGTVTACADDTTTVRAYMSEPVKGMFTTADFTIEGENAVTSAQSSCTGSTVDEIGAIAEDVTSDPGEETPGKLAAAPGAVVAAVQGATADSTYCDLVVLTLAQAIESDDTPVMSYAFQGEPVRSRPTDGPLHELGDRTLDAIDGIVPDLPSLLTVTQDGLDSNGAPVSNERGAQNGAFYTNQSSPVFNIDGLGEGYHALIALDSNSSGNYEEGVDTILADCLAEGATDACTLATPLGADGSYELLLTSLDPEGNLSKGRTGANAGLNAVPFDLVLDHVAPAASGFAVPAIGSDLTVAFTEALSSVVSRDAAEDWIPRLILANGKRQRFVVGSVTGSGDSRTVSIDDSEFSGTVDELLYTFQGTPDLRYQDLAGNYLGNFLLGTGI